MVPERMTRKLSKILRPSQYPGRNCLGLLGDLSFVVRAYMQLLQLLSIALLLEESGQDGEKWLYQCPICTRTEEHKWTELWPVCDKSVEGKSHKAMPMAPLQPVV
jgi:hypothetical protein